MDGGKRLLADEIMISFWTTMPNWVNALFKLRNVLVRPFGLSTGENEERSGKLKEMIRKGSGSNGLMSVVGKTENETLVLLSDKHLDAYVSVFVDKKNNRKTVTTSTLVRYHNKLGKIYFFFVCPFHKVIVKSILKDTLRKGLA